MILKQLGDFIRDNYGNVETFYTTKIACATIDVIVNYAKFHDMKLQKWMFFPCNYEGHIMDTEYLELCYTRTGSYPMNKYQHAKDRVIFKNCRLVDDNMIFIGEHDTDLFLDELEGMKVEDLFKMTIKTDWELTEYGQKLLENGGLH